MTRREGAECFLFFLLRKVLVFRVSQGRSPRGVQEGLLPPIHPRILPTIQKERAGGNTSVPPQETSALALTPTSRPVAPTEPSSAKQKQSDSVAPKPPDSVAPMQSASVAPVQPASSPSVQQATVEFWSSPAGADIEVDGKYIGSTPSTVTVQAGDHTITMRRQDCKTWQKTMKVTSGNLRVAAYMQQVGVTLH